MFFNFKIGGKGKNCRSDIQILVVNWEFSPDKIGDKSPEKDQNFILPVNDSDPFFTFECPDNPLGSIVG